jgi:predicted enzyme related to lactoylglutathione lyase
MSFSGDMQLYGAGEVKVSELGGKVIRPKFSIGDYGWVSLCADTEENTFDFSSMN